MLPAALVLHGFPGVAPIMNDLAWSLCQGGFVSMMFHYRGCWGSSGNYSFLGALEDAKKALKVLVQRKEIDVDRIAVLGHSFGGLIAIRLGVFYEWIKAVAAFCPVASLIDDLNVSQVKTILKRGLPFVFGLTMRNALKEWKTMANRHDPLNHVGKLSPRPFLLMHGDEDDIIPINCSIKLFSKAQEPKEKVIVKGVDHIFAGKQRLVVDKTVAWLKLVFP